MMKDSLDTFLRSLTGLRQHVQNIGEKNNLLDIALGLPCATSEIKDSIIRLQSVRSDEKQFDYTVIIISLYGQYETFVEQVIKEYLKELRIANYHFSELPHKIQEGYFIKSAKLQTKTEWEKYSHIADKDISKSLYDTLNLDIQNILPEAFFTNAGNYSMDILASCLGELGVENLKQTLCKYPPLQSYYKSKYGNDININEKDDEIRYGLIDEVVETRNRIAHTGTVDEIKDSTYISDILGFFEVFAKSLNMFIQDCLIQIKWDIVSKPCFKPDNYFDSVNVVSFKGYSMELHIDQKYICKHSDGVYPQFDYSKILGIQYDKVDYTDFVLKDDYPDGVGVKINHKATRGCSFMFL